MTSVTLTLTPAEQSELMKQINGLGGWQTLFAELQALLQANGNITLSDELLGRIVRMAHYTQGGYQGRLRKAFGRSVKSMVSW